MLRLYVVSLKAPYESYRTGPTQSVSVDGQLSDPLPVTIGVPQGSILGPLLFLLYLNDLPSVTESCSVSLFDDDTVMDNHIGIIILIHFPKHFIQNWHTQIFEKYSLN